jgi:hypothetical protein
MKKRKNKISPFERERRARQAKMDYQIRNQDKIFKEEERKRRDWYLHQENEEGGE